MGWVRVKIESRARVMEKLAAALPNATSELAAAELAAGEMLADRIRARAPVRTGRYRASIRADLLKNNPSKRNNVASKTKDENAVGIYGMFIWRWLEFGTVHMAARPHIFPTYRAAKREIRRMMAKAVNTEVKKAKAA
jgi:HK97 gp10 family phage protein